MKFSSRVKNLILIFGTRGAVIRKHFGTVLGFAVSGILLYLMFHQSGFELQKLVLTGRQWCFFTASCAAFCVSVWIQSKRTKLFWVGEERNNTLSSIIIGNFYSSLLPGNLGDGVRVWHFSRKNKIALSRSAAAIVAEKWIDAQLFVPGILVFFSIRPFKGTMVNYIIVYTALAAFILTVIYFIMRRYRFVEKGVWRIVISFGKPGRLLFNLYWQTTQHLINLRKRGLTGYYIALCYVAVVPIMAQFFFLFKCAGIPQPVASLYSSYYLLATMMIVAFIPSAPGNIGVLHYGIYAALISVSTLFNFKPDGQTLQNFALYAVLLHLTFVIPEIILGAIVLIKEREKLFGREPVAEI